MPPPNPHKDPIQQLLDEMRENFTDELPEKINAIELLFLQMETSRDSELFNDVYRKVHSLKGSGGTYGLQIITDICHLTENILGQYKEATTDHTHSHHLLLVCVDMLRDALLTYKSESADFSEIVKRIQNITIADKSQCRILLLETSYSLSTYYKHILAKLTDNYEHSHDSLYGLKQLLSIPYRIVIIGRELHPLNGAALLLALRASNNKNAQIPAIILSSEKATAPDIHTLLIERTPDHGEILFEECKKILSNR